MPQRRCRTCIAVEMAGFLGSQSSTFGTFILSARDFGLRSAFNLIITYSKQLNATTVITGYFHAAAIAPLPGRHEIWSANNDDFSFMFSFGSPGGPGFAPAPATWRSCRPLYENRAAIKRAAPQECGASRKIQARNPERKGRVLDNFGPNGPRNGRLNAKVLWSTSN